MVCLRDSICGGKALCEQCGAAALMGFGRKKTACRNMVAAQ